MRFIPIRNVFLLLIYIFTSESLKAELPTPRYQHIFADILSKLQLGSAKIRLNAVNELASTAQVDSVNEYFIVSYDNKYFDAYPDVIFIGTICHELGHVLLHHIGPTDKSKEMAADSICGRLMHQLSFQRVEDAFEFLNTAGGGNGFYPSKVERKQLIARGWNQTQPLSVLSDYVAFNPFVVWNTVRDTLIVTINERVIKDKDLYSYGYGIFYDSLTFTTYQLHKFSVKAGRKGAGRMVNNKTTLVYRRVGKHSFLLYDKGEIIETADCHSDKGGYFINGDNDLEITCYNNLVAANVTYILRMYGIAPNNFLFPVYKK